MENMKCEGREKYWEEMNVEQKLEKLAWVVSNLNRRIGELEENIFQFQAHDHKDGRIFSYWPDIRGERLMTHRHYDPLNRQPNNLRR